MASIAAVPSPPNGFTSKGPAANFGNGLPQNRLNQARSNLLQGSSAQLQVSGRRKKHETLSETFRAWLLEHQIGISINLLIIHALTHALLPRAREVTRPFFQLSYHNPATGLYYRGSDDFYFVAYWTVVFTGLRAACMDYVLYPLARFAGIKKQKTQTRFAEQAWLLVYYTPYFSLGMYLMYNSKYWMNFRELWTDFPVLQVSGLFKWYYLTQFAFWVQQIVVVNIEERRKDHWQMFTHHIVTCMLIFFSYGYYQHKAGNVILCIMDGVDIALSLAKDLKYARFQMACDIMFGIFILSWFLARHLVYLTLCWSVEFDVLEVMTYGCYSSTTGEYLRRSPEGSDAPGGTKIFSEVTQPYTNPGAEICYNYGIRYAFLGLLFALQGITIMWFMLILRVAYRVLKGKGADDSRSDSEDSGEEAEEEKEVESRKQTVPVSLTTDAASHFAQPVEEVVGVDDLTFTRKNTAAVRSRAPGTSSGLQTISDKKGILNRIGCDTKSS